MKTAYCPKSNTQLAQKRVGKDHLPGNRYHDVSVIISMRLGKYRVHVCESWGSLQGYGKEDGRREACGLGSTIASACDDARERAVRAGIGVEPQSYYLEQALCLAKDAAEEAVTS